MEPRDLYGLPLERFVPERAALAKTLREEGRREQAAEVSALRKPSVAAWAVNQLVRTQGRIIDSLYEAGDRLQQAQAGLIAGRADPQAMREAMMRERAAVNELVDKARGLLSSQGHELSPATLERVSETLHAAALDADARAEVRDGCLHKELRHVGLGSGGAPPAASKRARGGRSKSAPGAPGKDAKRDAQRLSAARKAEADARRAAERTGRELKGAREHRDRLARSLDEAEAALAAAQERADQAERAHERASAALERETR
jgi:hypothetical protein